MKRKITRAELLAQAKNELAIARSALADAMQDGAPDYECGQYRAAIRRCEDDLAALQPQRLGGGS